MQKAKRLLAIEKLIGEENVSTQEYLLKKLKRNGITCTQATLSRNLRQIGAGRIPDGTGGYKYAMPENLNSGTGSQVRLNIVPVIQEIVDARGLLVVKTIPGNASNTAFFIDSTGRYEIAGTIAGDDTILIIPRDGITVQQVHDCLETIMPGLHEQVRRR